jgi:hypothetical protein
LKRIKYNNGSTVIQKKYGNVNMLSGKWNVGTNNPKYNLSATGKLNTVKDVTASFRGNKTTASISSDLKGNTSANYRRQLRGNSSLSGTIKKPKGGSTYYGITYQKSI